MTTNQKSTPYLPSNPWASSARTGVAQFTSGRESVPAPMTQRFLSYAAEMFGGIFTDMNEAVHDPGKRLTPRKCCLASKQAKPGCVCMGIRYSEGRQFSQRPGWFLMQSRSLGDHFAHALARTCSIPPPWGCPLSLQLQGTARQPPEPQLNLPPASHVLPGASHTIPICNVEGSQALPLLDALSGYSPFDLEEFLMNFVTKWKRVALRRLCCAGDSLVDYNLIRLQLEKKNDSSDT
ncbi:hypothetical protein EK904_002003 [Melospiza melodia maxima]|nr:hypothetical protein EK904_002003 [Melospiza melodia maxima]